MLADLTPAESYEAAKRQELYNHGRLMFMMFVQSVSGPRIHCNIIQPGMVSIIIHSFWLLFSFWFRLGLIHASPARFCLLVASDSVFRGNGCV